MFLTTKKQRTIYTRTSKLGKTHEYERIKTIALFRCDQCDQEFFRDLKHMDRRRLSDNYFHVCPNCDAKKFAQRKGVERKKIWDMPASTELPVGKF
jgi:hypothetical protein